MKFLNTSQARILTLILLVQASAYYAVAFRAEKTPAVGPLSTFPTAFTGWSLLRDQPIEPEVQEVLRADDILSREYTRTSAPDPVYLFIAFFKTQRYGQTPHSPMNCLPGSGWEPIQTGTLPIAVPGMSEPVVARKYLVARGAEQSVVLYWYQSHGRVIPSEYAAKFWLVADAIRYHRSDTALVRVVVPVREEQSAKAIRTGVEFIQATFPAISHQLPL